MSEKAQDASDFKEFTIESATESGRDVDVRLGVISFNYYEDLFSPTISAKVLIVSSGDVIDKKSLYDGLPIRGGEKVTIKIKPFGKPKGSGKNPTLDFSRTPMYVSKVSSVVKQGQREVLALELTSRESITNETTRVYEKYPKDLTIQDSIEKIVNEKLQSQIVDSDQTSNKYGFMGNLKKPYYVLVWLASKAVDDNEEAGYFFYQTKQGFKFKSAASLIKDGKSSPKSEYTYRSTNPSLLDYSDDNILTYSVTVNNDLISKLKRGMYSSFFGEYNPATGTYSTPEKGKYNIEDDEPETKLGKDFEVPEIVEANGFKDNPTRLMFSVADVGTIEKDAYVSDNESSAPAENAKGSENLRQSVMRYNLLFTQMLDIQVPVNTSLEAGDVIKCNFPKSSTSGQEFDPDMSGLYMIKELCHHFGADQSVTSMKLIRDTYGSTKRQ